MIAQPRVATADTFVLAEGPVWDPLHRLVRWVDIRRGLVLGGVLGTDGSIAVVERIAFAGTMGAIALSASGTWIGANGDDLVEIADGEIMRRIPILRSAGARRFNDGKPDARGRFLVGTLSLSGPSETEQLLLVETDGSWRVIDDDLTLSNGVAWSADGTRLYSADTMRQRVYARPYDAATGEAGTREVLIETAEGYPDGLCVDAADHLWLAMWGIGQVRRYSPAGELVQVIEVPAPHVSSVAFAGPLLETLVITTASDELTSEQLEAYPLSGRLFTAVPDVTGFPLPPWGGFTSLNETESA
jgi:sugar lactone lactonase YvrE